MLDRTLISVLSGLVGMFGWGTSDFLANQASDSIGHVRTFFWSQVAGIVLVGICVLVFGGSLSSLPLLALTAFTGVTYAAGYLFFYQGLERGNVTVISAVINLHTIFVIGVAYFAFGQRITTLQIPAIILMLIGILCVSVNVADLKKGQISLLKGVKETLFAVVLFGIFYWPLNEYIVERTDWLTVVFITKAVALVAVLMIARCTKQTVALPKIETKQKRIITGIGLLEALAVLGVSYGLSNGDSIIVAPVSSALTIVTVTLAIIFLKEKISRLQAVGIALTIIGIILTTL